MGGGGPGPPPPPAPGALQEFAPPARVSLEMLPARGRVAVFEAPRDASSLADSRRDSCLRCREPGPETVCIVKSDTSRGHLRARRGVMPSLSAPAATPPNVGVPGLRCRCNPCRPPARLLEGEPERARVHPAEG